MSFHLACDESGWYWVDNADLTTVGPFPDRTSARADRIIISLIVHTICARTGYIPTITSEQRRMAWKMAEAWSKEADGGLADSEAPPPPPNGKRFQSCLELLSPARLWKDDA